MQVWSIQCWLSLHRRDQTICLPVSVWSHGFVRQEKTRRLGLTWSVSPVCHVDRAPTTASCTDPGEAYPIAWWHWGTPFAGACWNQEPKGENVGGGKHDNFLFTFALYSLCYFKICNCNLRTQFVIFSIILIIFVYFRENSTKYAHLHTFARVHCKELLTFLQTLFKTSWLCENRQTCNL